MALVVALPVAFVATLVRLPAVDPEVEIPIQHFYVVTTVAATAFGISIFLTFQALKIQHYKLVLLAVGFMTMGGLFTVHALATPGVLLPYSEPYGPASASVVGISAFLSVLLPATLFAVAYTPALSFYERRMPFWPVGGLALFLLAGIFVFAVIALSDTAVIDGLPVSGRPTAYLLAVVGIVCLIFAGYRQLGSPRVALPLQTGLGLAFPLLAVALGIQVLAPPWTLAWWTYHFLMLAAVSLAVGAMILEHRSTGSFRTILEAALDLQVRADLEIEQVSELAALGAAIEARDRNTRGHTARVADLTVAIAREMGLPNRRLRMLARAALLHDIGKLETPDHILLKSGPLTDQEWIEMRRHPEAGVRILRQIGGFDEELEVVWAHHEHLDGSGYPRGLRGDEIPLGARILSVADVYDSLASDRPYRAGLMEGEIKKLLKEAEGSHLDPKPLSVLLSLLARRPADDRRRVPRAEPLAD